LLFYNFRFGAHRRAERRGPMQVVAYSLQQGGAFSTGWPGATSRHEGVCHARPSTYGPTAVRRIFDASFARGSRQYERADKTPLSGCSKTRSTSLSPPILMTANCFKPEFRRGSTNPKGLEGDCYNQLSYSLQPFSGCRPERLVPWWRSSWNLIG
jgi:hypothetical protein